MKKFAITIYFLFFPVPASFNETTLSDSVYNRVHCLGINEKGNIYRSEKDIVCHMYSLQL